MSHFAKVSKDVVSVKLICNYTVFYSYILLNNEIKQSELKLTHTRSFIRTSIFRVEPGPFLFSDQFQPGNVLTKYIIVCTFLMNFTSTI